MAADLKPSTWLEGWSEDGTNITLPIASIPFLDATEADGLTGDFRKVLWTLLQEVWAHSNSLPAADRPIQMTIRKSAQVNANATEVTATYTCSFVLAASGFEVQAE